MATRKFKNGKGNIVKNTEILYSNSTNNEVLLHYGTPIAGFIYGRGYVRVDHSYSPTSTKHANLYCGGKDRGEKLPEHELKELHQILK